MPKLTFRQLVLSTLARLNGLSYKEIGSRIGWKLDDVYDALRRKRQKELPDETYEALLPGVTRHKAQAPIVKGKLETLFALEQENGLPEDVRAGIEEWVLEGDRRLRAFFTAAVQRFYAVAPEEDYPHAFELPIARRLAEEQFAELKRLPAPSRLAVVRLNKDYQNWALMERCCEASVEEVSRNLGRAAAWARLALAIARRVRGPMGWRNKNLGYAFAHWANILKVQGELKAADSCLERAKRFWHAGLDPAGALNPGRLFEIEGSLRRRQRRFDEALFAYDQSRAVSPFPERALIMKGFTYEVMGDYESAIANLLAAGPLVERRGDSRLLYMQRFNLAVSYANVSCYPQAAELLEQVRTLVLDRGDEIEISRVIWLEGRILAGLGRPGKALQLFEEARQRFAAEKLFLDVALAVLEESSLLLDQNRTGEVKALTLELKEVFESQGVHREARAALRLFQDAVEREAATAELARRILQFLFRARHDEDLKFES
jgi:tetratricopeptide (TPR) repeat protein